MRSSTRQRRVTAWAGGPSYRWELPHIPPAKVLPVVAATQPRATPIMLIERDCVCDPVSQPRVIDPTHEYVSRSTGHWASKYEAGDIQDCGYLNASVLHSGFARSCGSGGVAVDTISDVLLAGWAAQRQCLNIEQYWGFPLVFYVNPYTVAAHIHFEMRALLALQFTNLCGFQYSRNSERKLHVNDVCPEQQ